MMHKARITGTGSAAPERILTNKDFEGIVDTSDEWITRRTGIKERHIASNARNESTADLASQAGLKAMEMAGISAADLDMIVVGTVTPDQQIPSAACMIQEALNAENAFAFDVSAGCTGFLYALWVVNNAISAGSCRKALVVGVDRLSTILNWQDRGTCVLLGDGAGAVVVESTEKETGIVSTHLKSDGKAWDLLYSTYGNAAKPEILDDMDLKPYYLIMDGNRLYKKAVSCLSSIGLEALSHNDLTSDDITLVIPHQANMRIIQATAERMGVSMDMVYTNVEKFGNTSSGSIPIALDEAHRKGLLKTDDYVLLVAFGAGLTWGSALVKWDI
ncbi:MAG: beta-ketoacyl-ACP synthase III [Desulfobacterales bacterium]